MDQFNLKRRQLLVGSATTAAALSFFDPLPLSRTTPHTRRHQ
jgi:hypothetical protein